MSCLSPKRQIEERTDAKFVMVEPNVNAATAIEQIKSEHRSLAILRLLHREMGYRANDLVLQGYLETIALSGASGEIRDCIDRLERGGFVKTEWQNALVIVQLTARGEDAATGAISVAGVLRPGPECPY
jgi:hypothetical protein